jgi:hypothetical protein
MFDGILELVSKFVPDTKEAKRLESEVMNKYTKAIENVKMQQFAIIKAEQKAGGLTSKWRPYLMVLCMVMIGTHFLLTQVFPFIIVTSGSNLYYPILDDLSPELWSFLKLGIGGYVGARSLEKIAESTIKHWKK